MRQMLDRIDPRLKLEVTRRVVYDRSALGVYVWTVLQRRASRSWKAHPYGRIPPAMVKHSVIRDYATQFGTRVLVETGTFLGDTIFALRNQFEPDHIDRARPATGCQARRRFAQDQHVSILLGDSGQVLHDVLRHLDRPTLFWLDAHYSGGVTAHGATKRPSSRSSSASWTIRSMGTSS